MFKFQKQVVSPPSFSRLSARAPQTLRRSFFPVLSNMSHRSFKSDYEIIEQEREQKKLETKRTKTEKVLLTTIPFLSWIVTYFDLVPVMPMKV